jgi:tetratricopeptide (TPR) repeat protein
MIGMRRMILAAIVVSGLSAGIFLSRKGDAPADDVARLRRHAAAAAESGRTTEAMGITDVLIERRAANPHDLQLAARAAWKSGDAARAAQYAMLIEDDGDLASLEAMARSAELLREMGRLAEAERRFRLVLSRRPEDFRAQRGLAELLASEGRAWEARPHLGQAVRADGTDFAVLGTLGNTDRAVAAEAELKKWQEQEPDNKALLIGLAHRALVRARARLGLLLTESGLSEDFDQWRRSLMAEDEKHPVVWLAYAHYEEHAGREPSAIRCFWEAARRDPDNRVAHFRLGQLLQSHLNTDVARRFQDRASRLDELEKAVDHLVAEHDFTHWCAVAGQTAEALGRLWEARAWWGFVLTRAPQDQQARSNIERLDSLLTVDTPRQLLDRCPALEIDLSDFPLPDGNDSSVGLVVEPAGSGSISFVEEALERGLEFTYFNGDDPATPERRIFETTGGGIGVLDYDADGWPDLVFTQGTTWPPGGIDASRTDRLLRNLGGSRFVDVTAMCRLEETGFGQGVAVGDADNDGFQDVLVTNLGTSQLFRNQGDGTFTLWNSDALAADPGWGIGGAIADLNGDTAPDIYLVRYLAGELVRSCNYDGQIRGCPPDEFESAPDQLLLATGDGRFEDHSQAAGIVLPNSLGMGLIVADFDGSGHLGVFVGNDAQPNFLFIADSSAPEGVWRYSNQALFAGVAADRLGSSQSSMGIAAGDANGDGRMDLAITNYIHDGATLYVRRSDELLFEDESARSGLESQTQNVLGFGAQFLDADLDGWPDLIMANGHVEDFRFQGIPFAMRAQCFRNVEGRFVEVPAAMAGPYFERELFGRGLARLDWNRDGREDVVISNMLAPAALLTNATQTDGHWLSVELRGVSTARDAIGATVTVSAGGREWTMQLTAGDGYMASNQRRLHFGLGAAATCERLTVRWPSGAEQTWTGLAGNRHLMLIEGGGRPIDLTFVGH